MPAIGFVTRLDDDSYRGRLTTLTIQAPLELCHNKARAGSIDPDYLVLVRGMEVGFGWKKLSQATRREYVTISLATPEFGAKSITANLGALQGGNGNSFAVIWNPE